jgi:hypothetical protein
MKYYGARWGRTCTPTDLFNPYRTSSKYVKRYIEEHGIPDVIEVRRTFNCPIKAQTWEHTVLKRIDAAHRPDYLNKTNGDSKFYVSLEACLKRSKTTKGKKKAKPFTEEHCKHLSEAKRGKNNPMWGKKRLKHAEFMRERRTGENNPMFGKPHPRKGMPNGTKGILDSEETKRKKSIARKLLGSTPAMVDDHIIK